jgi:hypothetical protein
MTFFQARLLLHAYFCANRDLWSAQSFPAAQTTASRPRIAFEACEGGLMSTICLVPDGCAK